MGRRLGFELDAPEANSGTGSESHLATYISKGFKPEPIDIRGLRDLKKKGPILGPNWNIWVHIYGPVRFWSKFTLNKCSPRTFRSFINLTYLYNLGSRSKSRCEFQKDSGLDIGPTSPKNVTTTWEKKEVYCYLKSHVRSEKVVIYL